MEWASGDRIIKAPESLTLKQLRDFGREIWDKRGDGVDRVIKGKDVTQSDQAAYARFSMRAFAWLTGEHESVLRELPAEDMITAVNWVLTVVFQEVIPIDGAIQYKGDSITFCLFEKLNAGELCDLLQVSSVISEKGTFEWYPYALSILRHAGKGLTGDELEDRVKEEINSGYWDELPLGVVNGLIFFYRLRSIKHSIGLAELLAVSNPLSLEPEE